MKPLLLLFLLALPCAGATRYVDSAATGANNGTSWANAWTNLAAVSASAGDTVYISGGSSGQTRTYSGANWAPAGGSSGSPIVYQIGQDSSHNGTAVFDCGGGTWLTPNPYTVLSGDAGDGSLHFALTNCVQIASVVHATGGRISYVNGGTNLLSDGIIIWVTSGENYRVDHCYAKLVAPTSYGPTQDHLIIVRCDPFWSDTDSVWDKVIFWANEFHCPRTSRAKACAACGADFIQDMGGPRGITIVSNSFVGDYSPNVYGDSCADSANCNQHQDAVQFLGSQYQRVACNLFVDCGNSATDSADGTHWLFYDNIIVHTSTDATSSIGSGFDLENSGTDMWVLNNTLVNMPGGLVGANFNGTAYTNCGAANNLAINCAPWTYSFIRILGGDVSDIANQENDSGFSTWFTGYATSGIPNMRLTSAGSTALAAGTNLFSIPVLSAYMSFLGYDADGKARPATGAWAVGAYEYSSGSTNVPSVPHIYSINGKLVRFIATP